ncbi:MAG: hypothetical protein Q9227_006853 [Pyrenula ochraceoflavens]
MAPASKTVNGLHVILGAGMVGDASDGVVRFSTAEATRELIDAFYARGYTRLDTARGYSPHAPGTSEPLLGKAGVEGRFTVDTKLRPDKGFARETVEREVQGSLETLGVGKINIEYLHGPDKSAPFEETLEAINDLYKAEKFTQFGLSNHSAKAVDKFTSYAAGKGWIKPSTKVGEIYKGWFYKDDRLAAADKIKGLAEKQGITGHATALRWIAYHSCLSGNHGDGLVLGVSSIKQLHANLDALEAGPLPKGLAAEIETICASLGKTESNL